MESRTHCKQALGLLDESTAAPLLGNKIGRDPDSNCGGYAVFPSGGAKYIPSPKRMTTPVDEVTPDGEIGAGCRSVKSEKDCKKDKPDCERHVIIYTLDDGNFNKIDDDEVDVSGDEPDYHAIGQKSCGSDYTHQTGNGNDIRGPFKDPATKAKNYFDLLKKNYKKIVETHYCCPKDPTTNSK